MDGPWADPLRRRFIPEDLAPLAEAHGVDATVVVQAIGDIDETRELLAIASTTPLIAGVVGWVDLLSPDVADQLAALMVRRGGEKLVGIRHQVQDEPDPGWLLRPEVIRGLSAVASAGMAFDLLVKPPQLDAAVEVVDRVPELLFVVDHLAKPDIAGGMGEPWTSGVAALAAAPNVTAKLSGLVTEADWRSWSVADLRPYVAHAVEQFGSARLLFGSDWPMCLLAADYHRVFEAVELLLVEVGLSTDEMADVFGNTARRVYDLENPGFGGGE
jgi:L-fuconolactonase